MTRRDLILAVAEDAGGDFARDDRKDDEELGQDDLIEAIEAGEVTMADILAAFEKGVLRTSMAMQRAVAKTAGR